MAIQILAPLEGGNVQGVKKTFTPAERTRFLAGLGFGLVSSIVIMVMMASRMSQGDGFNANSGYIPEDSRKFVILAIALMLLSTLSMGHSIWMYITKKVTVEHYGRSFVVLVVATMFASIANISAVSSSMTAAPSVEQWAQERYGVTILNENMGGSDVRFIEGYSGIYDSTKVFSLHIGPDGIKLYDKEKMEELPVLSTVQ